MNTTPVRPEHEFDVDALGAFLRARLADATPVAQVSQFSAGQSNPTFMLTSAQGRKFVLRKKPPGVLLPSAHMIDREFRVMSALADSGFPVPPPRLFCDDESVIGTAFYLMDFVPGRIIEDPLLPDLSRAQRTSVYTSLAQTLAALHTRSVADLSLTDFGKQGDYISRQIKRWSRQYESCKTEYIEEMETLIEWLPQNIPAPDETCVVHGDYRLGNVILNEDETGVLGVLDWELATLGHPLSDLAYCCLPYHLPADTGVLAGLEGADLAALGIPDEAEFLRCYANAAGRDLPEEWSFYIAFSFFRLAAIVQGVFDRGLKGNASAANATQYGERTIMFARAGHNCISASL